MSKYLNRFQVFAWQQYNFWWELLLWQIITVVVVFTVRCGKEIKCAHPGCWTMTFTWQSALPKPKQAFMVTDAIFIEAMRYDYVMVGKIFCGYAPSLEFFQQKHTHYLNWTTSLPIRAFLNISRIFFAHTWALAIFIKDPNHTPGLIIHKCAFSYTTRVLSHYTNCARLSTDDLSPCVRRQI